MIYSERVSRLIRLFKELGISQFEGEHLLKTKELSALEEMFGLV